jgi:alpha,alpha-trehalose phosphorylase
MCWLGTRFEVEIREDEATYRKIIGEPVEISHHGEPFTVGETAVSKPIPPLPPLPPVTQPAGRAPARRDAERVRRNLQRLATG